jgi:hypothetical protein
MGASSSVGNGVALRSVAPVSYPDGSPNYFIPRDMTPERLLTTILALAFLAAPSIALLYGPGPGLFVLAGTLAATIGLAWSVRGHVPRHARQKLQAMLVLNGVLLVAAVVALLIVAL